MDYPHVSSPLSEVKTAQTCINSWGKSGPKDVSELPEVTQLIGVDLTLGPSKPTGPAPASPPHSCWASLGCSAGPAFYTPSSTQVRSWGKVPRVPVSLGLTSCSLPLWDFTSGPGKPQPLRRRRGRRQTQYRLTHCVLVFSAEKTKLPGPPCLVLFTSQTQSSLQPPPHETTSSGTTGPQKTERWTGLVEEGAGAYSQGRVRPQPCPSAPIWPWPCLSASLLRLLTRKREIIIMTTSFLKSFL